jgi:hypothetical protein
MQLRHISPGSIDWVDAMDEGGRGWEKLAPEELTRLRQEAQASSAKALASAASWPNEGEVSDVADRVDDDDYGWGAAPASR